VDNSGSQFVPEAASPYWRSYELQIPGTCDEVLKVDLDQQIVFFLKLLPWGSRVHSLPIVEMYDKDESPTTDKSKAHLVYCGTMINGAARVYVYKPTHH